MIGNSCDVSEVEETPEPERNGSDLDNLAARYAQQAEHGEDDDDEMDADAEVADDWVADAVAASLDRHDDDGTGGVYVKLEDGHADPLAITSSIPDSPVYDERESSVADAPVKARTERASSTTSSLNLKGSTRSNSHYKRKLGQDSPGSTPAPVDRSSDVSVAPTLVPSSIPGFFSTRNYAINRANFRYLPCRPSPSWLPLNYLCQIIHSPPANIVRFSWEDRSHYVHIAADATSITTEKGFRSARANVPIREGAWYYEVLIEKGVDSSSSGLSKPASPASPHVRIGISRREAPLNAPVGFDGYSYGFRDKTGEKVHISETRPYGQPFVTGDVVGVYVYLPPRPKPLLTAEHPDYNVDPDDPSRIVRKLAQVHYKGQLYLEATEYVASKEMEDLAARTRDPVAFEKALLEAAQKKSAPPPGKRKAPAPPKAPPARPLPILPGSRLAFFVNGVYQGVAFEDMFDFLPLRQHAREKPNARTSLANAIHIARENHHDDGSLGYYPTVSVYSGGTARLNPGPDFAFPPLPNFTTESDMHMKADEAITSDTSLWRPLCQLYEEHYSMLRYLDEIDERVGLARYEAKVRNGLIPAVPAREGGRKASVRSASPASAPTERSTNGAHTRVKARTTLSKEMARSVSSGDESNIPTGLLQYDESMHRTLQNSQTDADEKPSVNGSPVVSEAISMHMM